MTEPSAIIPFNFDAHTIRSALIDGEPWFVATDLASVLGYRDAHDATHVVDDEDKGTEKLVTLGGLQALTVVNESGLYSMVFRSRMPSAKQFKRWVTKDVLPTIRKTGGYGQSLAQADAMRTLRHVHQLADAEIERRTRHDFHKSTQRAQERIEAAVTETAAKYALNVEAVRICQDRGADEALATVYQDPAAIERVQRNRTAIEAAFAERLRLEPPKTRKGTRGTPRSLGRPRTRRA